MHSENIYIFKIDVTDPALKELRSNDNRYNDGPVTKDRTFEQR